MDSLDPHYAPVPVAVPAPPAKLPWYSWRRLGYNFLTLSLLVHLLLGIGATYFVVSVSYPKKKTFAAPPASGNQRAAEHKVNVAKTQQRSSAPMAVKRVVTTGASKVALPAMPVVAVDNSAITPVSLSGMDGTGLGGLGTGGGTGGGNGGGGAPSFFGVRTGGKGLTGTFYDLKQNQSRQPTGMNKDLYIKVVTDFVRANCNTGMMARYYHAPQSITAERVFTPNIPAELGPKAFGVEKEVQPSLWIVHYKGSVVAPETGTFHFVGCGDDVMMVRFDNRLVCDGSRFPQSLVPGQEPIPYRFNKADKPFMKGPGVQVEQGKTYPIDIVIGERPGQLQYAELLIMKDGDEYKKNALGELLLPIFRVSSNAVRLMTPPPGSPGYASHAEGGPVWLAVAATAPEKDFSVFKQ